MYHLLDSVLRVSTRLVAGRPVGRFPPPAPPPPPVLTHVEAHSSMPWDSTPLIFWGFRLHSTTTSRSCSSSLGTNCTRPLTTVRGSASPTSTFSTYRLSASGCCRQERLVPQSNGSRTGPGEPSDCRGGHPTPQHRLLGGPLEQTLSRPQTADRMGREGTFYCPPRGRLSVKGGARSLPQRSRGPDGSGWLSLWPRAAPARRSGGGQGWPRHVKEHRQLTSKLFRSRVYAVKNNAGREKKSTTMVPGHWLHNLPSLGKRKSLSLPHFQGWVGRMGQGDTVADPR